MRRGFKAWCERTSTEYRQALGIPQADALDPRRLASLLGVRVTTPEQVQGLSEASLHQLTVADPDSWSAVTLSDCGRRLVILNSGHSWVRQTSSLTHELAHIILNHSTDSAQLSTEGFLLRRTFDKAQEEEADWFSGCLLVPRDGLLDACRADQSVPRLTAQFRVSADMVIWRLLVTGVLRQVRRFQALRRIGSAAV